MTNESTMQKESIMQKVACAICMISLIYSAYVNYKLGNRCASLTADNIQLMSDNKKLLEVVQSEYDEEVRMHDNMNKLIGLVQKYRSIVEKASESTNTDKY